jgi:hypothetical protein
VPLISLLSVFALAVQGYHPFSEDGGLYAAGIERSLDPTLFPVHPEFVLAHLRFSPFAEIVAGPARVSHLPLAWVLLALYCGSVWATLYAAWMLAGRCAASVTGRCGAVALLACWLTMPIAGTSLMLADPYVTSRCISTPLTLAAIAWALDGLRGSRRGWALCGLALALAMIHPLMAGYALATVLVLLAVGAGDERIRRWAPWGLGALALAVAGVIQMLAPPESPAYVRAAITRYYWFLARWQWYELFGLAGPLALLWILTLGANARGWKPLARTALVLGVIAIAVALLFAREGLATHLVARLQPLRSFQIVYEIFLLMLGAWLGERWLNRHIGRWLLALAVLGGAMFCVQRNIYPASQHFEWPGQTPRNPWMQAFVWVRDNTPKDAFFALDAHYITQDGEDAQGFRGIAQRSALPDYSKDGGEASITPALAEAWFAGQAAQNRLSEEDDRARIAILRPLGVGWVVLQQAAPTRWPCPYRNRAAKVCRLP